MSNKNGAGTSSSAWVWGGGVVAVAIAAASYLYVSQNAQPTPQELDALVPQTAPVQQEALETGPVNEIAESVDETEQSAALDTNNVAVSPQKEREEATAEVAEDLAEADSETQMPEAAANPTTPSIDEVRLAADGVAVVAGRAEPGATVDVIVDGDVVASAQADAGGSFAAVGFVEAEDTARVLSLRAGEGETAVASQDEVIIAPVFAPNPEPESLTQSGAAVTGTEPDQEPASTANSSVSATQMEDVAPAKVPEAESASTSEIKEVETPLETVATPVEEPGEAPETQTDAPNISDNLVQAPETAAPPQIALLKSDETGVTLLQAAPQPSVEVQLDTIGYSGTGAVELAGRAGPEASEVRVYLNNRSVADFPIGPEGNWRGNVQDIEAGVYTLRVDAVNASGNVTSRLETPFKREAPEILAEATANVDGPVTAVTVQRGDTLWAIARDRYGEGLLYVQVFEANRSSIRDPDLIYPGQIFELPAE